jgi:hypothetical protein
MYSSSLLQKESVVSFKGVVGSIKAMIDVVLECKQWIARLEAQCTVLYTLDGTMFPSIFFGTLVF